MRCYHCNSKLNVEKDTCLKCGADIRYYKKIIYMSNRYYNEGLFKAQGHDLSGAKESLKISLQLNKKNTNARNLLGLVYYAMGEAAEALKQWVLSKNIQVKDNVADAYINHLKDNKQDLDSDVHGIRKFNQALEYAKNDSTDLAVIQLKKVISVHPQMVKAYELLALIYMNDQKYEQAKSVLKKCLEVDHGNPTALYYMRMLQKISGKSTPKKIGLVGEEDREQLIIPVRFRDYGSYLANALYIFLGVILGIGVLWFIIVPSKVQSETGDEVAAAMSYEARISSLESERASLSEEAEKMKSEVETTEEVQIVETTEAAPALATGENQNTNYVTTAVIAYNAGQWVEFVNSFRRISTEYLNPETTAHYNNLLAAINDRANFDTVMGAADAANQAADYTNAAALFDAAFYMQNEEAPLYQAGLAYEQANNEDLAAVRFCEFVKLFPNSSNRADAEARYKEIRKVDYVPDIEMEPRGPETMVETSPSEQPPAPVEETAPVETPAPSEESTTVAETASVEETTTIGETPSTEATTVAP